MGLIQNEYVLYLFTLRLRVHYLSRQYLDLFDLH